MLDAVTTAPLTLGKRALAALGNPVTLMLTVLVAYILFTRLWNLGLKPVQHDESMFAYYSYQILKSLHNPSTPVRGGALFQFIASIAKPVYAVPYGIRIGIILLSAAAFVFVFAKRHLIRSFPMRLAVLAGTALPIVLLIVPPAIMFVNLGGPGYKYMPILHGPVLEWVSATVFEVIGDSDATMRLFPALNGIFLLVLIYLMRERMGGSRAAWLAIFFLAISPTVTFFSRYNRSDIIFLCTATAIVYAGWRYAVTKHPLWLVALLGIIGYSTATMETYVVFFFLCCTFGLGCWIHGFVKEKPYTEIPFYRDLIRAFTRHWWATLLGLALAAFIIVTLFTSFYKFMEHWDGIPEAIVYWSGEHAKHRIEGPWHFHLLHMSIYELPFLIYFVVSIVMQMWPRAPHPTRFHRRILFFAWLGVSWLALVWPVGEGANAHAAWTHKFSDEFYDFTHMRLWLHVWLFIQIFIVVGITGWKHLNNGRYFHAWVDYWAGGSFLAYSYAGEKVPWVGMHVIIPMLISCAMYAELWLKANAARRTAVQTTAPPKEASTEESKKKKKGDQRAAKKARKPISTSPHSAAPAQGLWRKFAVAGFTLFAVIGLGWEIYLANFLVWKNSGSPLERHTYASSHMQFKQATDKIIAEVQEKEGRKKELETLVAYAGEPSWPLIWSFRHFKNVQSGYIPDNTKAEYILIDNGIYEGNRFNTAKNQWERIPPPKYIERYNWERVRFRHYWQPQPLDWEEMKQIRLLLANPSKLSSEQRSIRERGRASWGKLFYSMLERNESRHMNPGQLTDKEREQFGDGRYRWNQLGGWDVYIGTPKTMPESES